jgi:aspartyl-tRNA(Asn)/glutamyl-tRNA(Gln) amidotransferase subunit C
MLSKDEVKHIADLARIEMSEKEIEKYQKQLGKILDFVDKLSEVKTDEIPTADGGIIDLENVWRSDDARNKKQKTRNNKINLIEMAGEIENGQVKVKSVF